MPQATPATATAIISQRRVNRGRGSFIADSLLLGRVGLDGKPRMAAGLVGLGPQFDVSVSQERPLRMRARPAGGLACAEPVRIVRSRPDRDVWRSDGAPLGHPRLPVHAGECRNDRLDLPAI